MTYDDVIAIYLTEPATAIPVPEVPASSARRLRDALEPIATLGWWSPRPWDRLGALGLGFFEGYAWGRAASMGTPTAGVVVAAFGVFEPSLLAAVYERAVATAARDEVLAARCAGAEESLATLVTGTDAAAVADPLLDALARVDGMGRPLFSGLRQLPVPATAAGRLWRAAELVREHRGDGHLAAGVAAGLDAVTMNVVTELWLGYPVGEYSGTRGFSAAAIAETVAALERRGWVRGGVLTDKGHAARTALEVATDATEASLMSLLGDDVTGLIASAELISERILAARLSPSDPRKRAAG